MKKNVIVDITGLEIIDDEDEKISVITTGEFYKKEETYYIVYNEILENEDTQKTTLKVKNNLVTMTRFGEKKTQLIIENGVRHQCFYQTEYGGITIGIMGNEVKNSLTDDGGELFFSYTLDINTNLSSEHKLTIKVKPE